MSAELLPSKWIKANPWWYVARDAARRILAEVADDGVTVAGAMKAAEARDEIARMIERGGDDVRGLADDLTLALAELASDDGLGPAGVAALSRVAS
jgi:hypothetical protein